jgi:hypothetical protein
MDDKTPIEFVPISCWRIILQSVARLVLYILMITVIIGPTILMIVSKTSPGEPSAPCVRPLVHKKAT